MLLSMGASVPLIDEADLHWLWKETHAKLSTFSKLVRECKQVTEAADFCRWLQFSGLPKIFKACPQSEPMPVNYEVIDKQIRDILFECGELFRTGKADPQYAQSDIAAINHKLDIIAAHVSTLSPPKTQTPTVDGLSCPPALSVMLGGAS